MEYHKEAQGMTLHRQIILFTAALLFIVYCSVFVASTYNTRTLLAQEIGLNTQNTASTLGLILSIPSNKSNKNIMSPLVSSLLTGGFYNAIQILNDNSKIILNESVTQEIKGVPEWFMSLFPLDSQASAKTLNGKVIVTAYTGVTYASFWAATINLFWCLLALYIISIVASIIIIKRLLCPLNVLSQQAQSIIANEEIKKNNVPQTQELKFIATAMNNLSEKALRKYEEERDLTERLHNQAYQEPVTSLGNRRYFDIQLHHLISEKIALGALFLIELQGLKQYNDKMGYEAGDELIRHIADVIKDNCQDIKANFLSRIGGSTFAILTPHLSDEEVNHLATCLIHAIETLLNSNKDTKIILAHIGIASLAGITDPTKALTFADIALKTAQSKGDFAYYQYENTGVDATESSSRNASDWKKYIDQIIADNLVKVAYQPIMNFPDKSIMGHEALLRVKGSEKTLTEARFIIPLANRYGLTYALDQCVIKQVLEHMKESKSTLPYVINLSASTLTNESSLQWLLKTVGTGEHRDKLIFELDEHTVLNNLDLVHRVSKQLKEQGIELAIEHYGNDFASFDSIKDLQLLYIKVDGSYIRDLSNQDTQFYIHFLTKVAHTVGMKVIAECLETEDQWNQLKSFQIDGAQGRYLAPPENGIA